MKNNYRKLIFTVLLQTMLITALSVLVGGFILKFIIDGIYNDSFANIFVDILMAFNLDEQKAIDLYWKLLGENKVFFLAIGYLALFALFFYIALSRMTK